MTFLFHDGCGDTRRTSALYDDSTRYISGSFAAFTTGLYGGTHTYAATSGTVTTASFAEQPTTSYIGARVRSKNTATATIISLISGLSTVQCYLRQTSDGTGGVKYQLMRTSSTVLAESGNYVIEGGTVWRYIQFRITLATGATGTAEIIVDDDSAVTVTSIQTSASGTTTDRLELKAQAANDLDDVYWCSDQGSAPYNTHLGQYVIEGIFPNGNGSNSDWDGSDGNSTDNYLLVDDGATSLDTDTTYVSTASTDVTDTYACTNLEIITGSILAVEATLHGRLETTGSQDVDWVVRTSASQQATDTITLDSVNYQGKGARWTANPVDSAAWAVADIDDGEFGFQIPA